MKLDTTHSKEPMEAELAAESSSTAGSELNNLSDPVILLILKNLTAVDLCAVAETSRRMRTIAKDHTLWRNVVIDLSNKSLGSDGGRSAIMKVVSGYLGDECLSLEIRPLERERNLQVETVKDGNKPLMRVEKQPPITLPFQMLVTIGTKCPSLETLRLVDCKLNEPTSENFLNDWKSVAHLSSLKFLVFQWRVAGNRYD